MKWRDDEAEYVAELFERRGGAELAKAKAAGAAAATTKTKVEGVLTVLEARGLKVPVKVRAQVRKCTSPAALDRLLRRAVKVEAAADLLR